MKFYTEMIFKFINPPGNLLNLRLEINFEPLLSEIFQFYCGILDHQRIFLRIEVIQNCRQMKK